MASGNQENGSRNSRTVAQEPQESFGSALFKAVLVGAGLGLAAFIGYKIIKELTSEELEKIPAYKVNRQFVSQNKECAICLDTFNVDEEVKTLECGHTYHSSCINQWVARCSNCPLCRKNC